jgi:hypothetical protein
MQDISLLMRFNGLKEHKNAFRVDKKVIKVRFLILYT